MSESLFKEFEPAGKDAWIAALQKELKGDDFQARFMKVDDIEGIQFPSYFHREDSISPLSPPGIFPYRRGNSSEGNDWQIMSDVFVTDEKQANKEALNLLLSGTNTIVFKLGNRQSFDFKMLLNEIALEYVQVAFEYENEAQMVGLDLSLQGKTCRELLFMKVDAGADKEILILENGVARTHEVNAYQIQQAGANAIQELAFALCQGHEKLFDQIRKGKSSDEALVSLHFTFGVGADYLLEIAKFRAFRQLWACVAREYEPKHRCNETASITAKIGFTNKSLQDPYTNLLRQTTESMSAVLGGVNQLWVQAYDAQSSEGASKLATRMANNISLMLKEESYLHLVQDASGGSYAIEQLTDLLSEQAWKKFQEMEASGGTASTIWREEIKETAARRIAKLEARQNVLIGINKFPDPEARKANWQAMPEGHWGLKALILEKELAAITKSV